MKNSVADMFRRQNVSEDAEGGYQEGCTFEQNGFYIEGGRQRHAAEQIKRQIALEHKKKKSHQWVTGKSQRVDASKGAHSRHCRDEVHVTISIHRSKPGKLGFETLTLEA